MRKCRTGKRQFHGEAQAKDAITSIRFTGNPDPDGSIPVRAYRCDLCGKWHLTSQMPRHGLPVPEVPETDPPAPDALREALADVALLEAVVRDCVAGNCGTCMHHPGWGAYRIRHMSDEGGKR